MAIPPNPDPWVVPGSSNDAAAPVAVYRLSGSTPQPLPSVLCVFVERHAGADPGTAGFRYAFDGVDGDAPQSAEQALDTAYTSPETVDPGDRLLVAATRPDGTREWLFDGIVLAFGLELDEDTEMVDFAASGIARTCWDSPIYGSTVRDASDPQGGADAYTEVVARFNPKGQPCMTDDGYNTAPQGGGLTYPVFLDPAVCKDRGIGRVATLPMAVRYILGTCNGGQAYVQNPDGAAIDSLLVSREPLPGSVFDPNDPATYTAKDIVVADRPITGRDWPSTLRELVRPAGFDLAFRLDPSPASGLPKTSLDFFHRQSGPAKSLYLPPWNSDFDPQYCNLGGARISRDLGEVVNQWYVDGALVRYEISVVLAPLFPMQSGDKDPANLPRYKKGSDHSKSSPNDYRLFGFDETGDGHYAPGSDEKVATPGSFGTLFGTDPDGSPIPGAVRRRPALEHLLTRLGGRPLEPRLSFSLDYKPSATGPPPCLWDGSGTWQPIAGGYRVLKDRLGVLVTARDPNAWQVGDSHDKGAPQKLNLVELLAAGSSPCYLMLTCAIEGDRNVAGAAYRRGSGSAGDPSPVTRTITRVVDARDRYFKEVVDYSSEYFDLNPDYNGQGEGEQIVQRDDADAAAAEAASYRAATEAGVLDGHATIPYLTTYFDVGDRIDAVDGRGLDLRTDGAGPGDAPVYPMITGVRWDLADGQATTLYLSDESAARHAAGRATGGPYGGRPLRIKGRGRNGERTLGR